MELRSRKLANLDGTVDEDPDDEPLLDDDDDNDATRVKIVNKKHGGHFGGDGKNIAVLLFLYVLQGIPLGLAAAVPLILTNRNVSYRQQAEFSFALQEPQNLPNPMLSMVDTAIGYPPPEDAPAGTPPTVIVRGINRSVMAGQRIGILGANGQGKSTLVKTIANDLKAISGEVTVGKGLNIGYFAQQELDVLRPQDTPLEHMTRLAREALAAGNRSLPGREQELRNFLGTFNFGGDMVKQAVGTMSGGEKARLVLCMLVWQRPNLLLMDEPTNHLDLNTREALAVALNEFEGTVMLVSHDRALLRSVCDEFWLVSKGGVGPFDGDLEDYQRYLLDEAKRVREEAKLAA